MISVISPYDREIVGCTFTKIFNEVYLLYKVIVSIQSEMHLSCFL